jgi:hypothetical protein
MESSAAARPEAEALSLLAAGFEARGAHAQAIRCLAAAAGLPNLLPAHEARLLAALSRALLRHTHAAGEARDHLLRAVRRCALPAALARARARRGPLTGRGNRLCAPRRRLCSCAAIPACWLTRGRSPPPAGAAAAAARRKSWRIRCWGTTP